MTGSGSEVLRINTRVLCGETAQWGPLRVLIKDPLAVCRLIRCVTPTHHQVLQLQDFTI